MARRKSIFEQIKDNELNLQLEYKTIKKLFEENGNVGALSFERAIDIYIIRNWKYNFRCINLSDLYIKLNISDRMILLSNYNIDDVLSYFELIYNLMLEIKKSYQKGYEIRYYDEDNYELILKNIRSVLENLNYEIVSIEDRWEIREKDIFSTAVAENNLDIADEILEYRRFALKGDLDAKKDIILKLSNKIEPLRTKFKGTDYNSVIEDAEFLLNNFNLRHNNLEGKNKNKLLDTISENELENIYDKAYDLILTVLMLNTKIDFEKDLKDLKSKMIDIDKK